MQEVLEPLREWQAVQTTGGGAGGAQLSTYTSAPRILPPVRADRGGHG